MNEPTRRREGGFALILAMLALMLLTFLGLTLATTTSTELQIATNYRWGMQALYNAEAGLDAGRAILRIPSDWSTILPPARTRWTISASPSPGPGVTQTVTLQTYVAPTAPSGQPSADEWGNPLRNFAPDGPTLPADVATANSTGCDKYGSLAGYGAVLSVNSTAYQYKTTLYGQRLNGAITLWVRRGKVADSAGLADGTDGFKDDTSNTKLVLTAEGIAPFDGSQFSDTTAQSARAVRVMEITVSKGNEDGSLCQTYSGQSGRGAEGAGFSGCTAVTDAGVKKGLGTSATVVGNMSAE